jgi:hypothetical protein
VSSRDNHEKSEKGSTKSVGLQNIQESTLKASKMLQSSRTIASSRN